MKNVTAKMVAKAKAEFKAYCAKRGNLGKTQDALENRYLELKKAYKNRKKSLDENGVVEFMSSDNFMTCPSFNRLYNRVLTLVADVVIAHDVDLVYEEEVCLARGEKCINVTTLLRNL